MNGGPYGRGKAPERRCLKVQAWPEDDRRLWEAACRPSDVLDPEPGGLRANHAIMSNRKAEKGYGRWLTFLQIAEPETLAEPPAARITQERVRRYVDGLLGLGNNTATVIARLRELGEVARVIGPDKSWRFINVLEGRIRARHRPARDKSNLRLSDELLSLGHTLIEKAAACEGRKAALLHRDGLMIALLALVPLRRRNFASLRLGRSVIAINDVWLITLDESETKTRAPLEILWPDELIAALRTYLGVHRPLLSAIVRRGVKPAADVLWVSSRGSPLTEMTIYNTICMHTENAFGRAVNPHLFRDAAATTLAIVDPAHVRVAAPLLGHRTFTTTERHYQQAKAFDAHRTYIDALYGKAKQA
jgi:integrase/recombinase XerD